MITLNRNLHHFLGSSDATYLLFSNCIILLVVLYNGAVLSSLLDKAYGLFLWIFHRLSCHELFIGLFLVSQKYRLWISSSRKPSLIPPLTLDIAATHIVQCFPVENFSLNHSHLHTCLQCPPSHFGCVWIFQYCVF